jgi:N-acetylglucosamine-6-phosphate deacetylase
MATQALVNGRVLLDDGFHDDVAVLLDGSGRIQGLVPEGQARIEAGKVCDLGGGWLLPGFIDVQVNGGGGVLFNNDTRPEAIDAIGRAHRRYGTTSFLPTLISDTAEVMERAIAGTREAIAAGVPGVLGIHLEGPYLAPARKGTHDAARFRVPDAAELAMATSLDNGVTLVTLAPEQVPADAIRAMVARGTIVCAGHTAGTYEQIRAGLEAGVRGFTHLYNAMSPLQGREPGTVGAALESREAYCGMIVDGVHVHPASLRVALAAKPRGTLFLVTDAMPMVGSDDPSFELYGETITAVDGVVRNAAGALAGSALDMATAVRNTVRLLGLPLEEAARMASTYPARFLGLESRLGRIAPGWQGDLVLLDEALQVQATWVAGVASDA